jgi:hypothetical protein
LKLRVHENLDILLQIPQTKFILNKLMFILCYWIFNTKKNAAKGQVLW